MLSLYEDPYGVKDIKSTYGATSIDTERQIILNRIVDQIKYYNGDKQSKFGDNVYEDNDIIGTSNSFSSGPISLKLHRRDEELNGSFKKKENVFNQKDNSFNVFIEGETRYRMLEYQKAKQNEDFSFSKLNPTTYYEQQSLLQSTCKYIRDKNKAAQEQAQNSLKDRLYSNEKSSGSLSNSKHDDDFDIYELNGPNVIKVKVSVFIDDMEEIMILSINKSRKVSDLRDLVINKLKAKYPFITDPSTLIQIVHRSSILDQDLLLEQYEVKGGSRFDMLVQEKYNIPTSQPQQQSAEETQEDNFELSSRLAPIDKLPIMKRKEYTLYPNLIEMARMTELQLSTVNDLCIENEYGQITWEGKTDVRGINFDILVHIDLYSATVYPEEIERLNLKPEIGKGLNKPAIIKLYKIFPALNSTQATRKKFVENLKAKTTKIPDAEFISYEESVGVFTFKVAHFTTYDFNSIYYSLTNLKRQFSESQEKQTEALPLLGDKCLSRRSSFKIRKDQYFDSWKTTFSNTQNQLNKNIHLETERPIFEGKTVEEFISSKSLGVIYEFKCKNLA